MEQPLYQVLLEGRTLGPYDRRTIVGMRIRKALASHDVLLASTGAQLTVADLVKQRPLEPGFQPNRSGNYSVVQATYTASLLGLRGPRMGVPAFKGEIEARVQGEVLRLAGRFRSGLRWKEDRVKVRLNDIVHARVRGSVVDLWLRQQGGDRMLRITLELFSPESACEFVDWLPAATPWPHEDSAPAVLAPAPTGHPLLWLAVAGTGLAVAGILVFVFSRTGI